MFEIKPEDVILTVLRGWSSSARNGR